MLTAAEGKKNRRIFSALPWLGMSHAFLCLLPFSTATAVWNLPPEFCVSNLKEPCPGRLKRSEFVGKREKIRIFFAQPVSGAYRPGRRRDTASTPKTRPSEQRFFRRLPQDKISVAPSNNFSAKRASLFHPGVCPAASSALTGTCVQWRERARRKCASNRGHSCLLSASGTSSSGSTGEGPKCGLGGLGGLR